MKGVKVLAEAMLTCMPMTSNGNRMSSAPRRVPTPLSWHAFNNNGGKENDI
ncbi:hypothetical protein ACFL96_04250 [Thermoproteota archaeon]